jgi:hypothetical protein
MKIIQDHYQFALCLDNSGYEVSLELGKVYRIVPDEQAAARGYVRVVDESGDDFAYAVERFHLVNLPQEVEQALLAVML